MQNVVAYIRVSTKGQGESGLGLDAQRAYIKQAAESNGWNVVGEFVDVVSGKLAIQDRPEGAKAMEACKAHNAQLLVAKLDRLSRSVLHIAQLMEVAEFKVATMPHASSFQLHLFAALAQQEREFITARTREALKALKANAEAGDTVAIQKVQNRHEAQERGRAVACIDRAETVRRKNITSYQTMIRPHLESCLFNKLSTLQSVADCLTAKGFTTPRGSEFTATSIKRLLASFDLSLAA